MKPSNDNAKHDLWDDTAAMFKRLGWRWPQCKQCRGLNPDRAIQNLNWYANFEIAVRETEIELKRESIKVVK